MKNIFKKSTALLLVFVIVLSLCSIGQVDIFGATHNVYQSRRIAEIDEFPESYRLGLQRVKSIYPNAQFVYYDTGLDWYNDILTEENHLRVGMNLIPASSPESWKSHDENVYDPSTNKYEQIEPGWNQASQEIIEYYMDPRNFFNEQDIFQFMDLSFTGTESVESTAAILAGSFMDNKTIKDNDGNDVTYAQALYDIGKATGVSPYLLACRIRQEQGSGTSALISGTYSKVPGYYNYFNVNAYGSTTERIITNGLKHAKSKGWDTPYKSIYGGAEVLAGNYVGIGKNCLYLQHFNMTAQNHTVDYRIYMANTAAPYNENKMMAKSLTDNEAAYTFIIPVYQNMPDTACEPPASETSANATLDYLMINDGDVSIGKFNPFVYKYKAELDQSAQFIILKAKLHDVSSSISINGIQVNLDGSNILEKGLMVSPGFNDFVITVKSTNGLYRDYELTVLNDDGNTYYRGKDVTFSDNLLLLKSHTTVEQLKQQIQTLNCIIYVSSPDGSIKDNTMACAPDDIIMILNEQQQVIATYKVVIQGDIDKDGAVTEFDIQLAKEFILEITNLSIEERKLADMDCDNDVDMIDLSMMRVITGEIYEDYSKSVTIYANTPEEVIGKNNIQAAIIATPGTYFTEGYLRYNEGQLEAIDEENSGKIHFIADGSNVLFDNNTSNVLLKTLLSGSDVDFTIDIIQSYDYTSGSVISVATNPSKTSVKNTEIDIAIDLNDDPVEGSHDYAIATITITNKMNRSLGNIFIDFGQYMLGTNHVDNVEYVGLQPGEKHKFDVLLKDGLSSGTYENAIKISYTTAEVVERMVQIDTTFEVASHDHTNEWKYTDAEHYQVCDLCDKAPKELHRYVRLDNGKYACSCCGYIKTMTVQIDYNQAKTNAASVFTPVVMINDQEVSADNYTFEWYINGCLVSTNKYASIIFRSIGTRQIQCVARDKDGLVAISTLNVSPQSSKQTILVQNINCNSVVIEKEDGYEYKLGNGQWQQSAFFLDLRSDTEYTIYRRVIGETAIDAQVKVYTSHVFDKVTVNAACEQNFIINNKCANCNTVIEIELENTKQKHVFETYMMMKEATCSVGMTEIASCEYGCGKNNARTRTETKAHSFVNYTPDGNASCTNAGTETAVCEYGCGAKDTRISQSITIGHTYNYTYNNDATGDASGTEIGICSKCGQTNMRTADKTRLKYVTNMQIILAQNQQVNRLPIVEITEDVKIKHVVWIDELGNVINDQAEIQPGQIYRLAQIVIAPMSGHMIYDHCKININGKTFANFTRNENGEFILMDVGQFQIQ